MSALKNLLRSAVYATPLFRYFAPHYRSTYVPAHLCRLIDLLDQTANVPGSVVEVGCWTGETTIWLNKHLKDQRIERRYYALDTFGGFTSTDLAHEVSNRGKKLSELTAFTSNRRSWFDRTMILNGFQNVVSIQADASKFDYAALAPIAFALVDLDLYLPMKSALQGVFSFLSEGGLWSRTIANPISTMMARTKPLSSLHRVITCLPASTSIGLVSP